MKIVLDTNCFIVCLPVTSPYYCIWKVVKATNFYRWNLITIDPDDNKFADCALNAGADYIVTNDKHFNVLKTTTFPYIKVDDIETFKRILDAPR